MPHHVSDEMSELIDRMAEGWVLCVKDYKAWRELEDRREPVSQVLVGRMLSDRLVRSVGPDADGAYRYELTDEGRATHTRR